MAMYLGKKQVDFITQSPEKPIQNKEVEASTKTQIIIPDFGYTLNRVTVEPFKDEYIERFYTNIEKQSTEISDLVTSNMIMEDLSEEFNEEDSKIQTLEKLIKENLET